MRTSTIPFLLLLAAAPAAATAQEPARLVDRGISAYDSLEFDAAAGWLRRVLAPPYSGDLTESDRRRAMTYLAATERFRGHPDSATAVFRRLLREDPAFRLDPVVFPPDVTGLFEEVRRSTKSVVVSTPPQEVVRGRSPGIPILIRATSTHDLRLELHGPDGALLKTLYAGPVEDSLLVRWDGRDSTGAPIPASGTSFLRATSLLHGQQTCLYQVPVEREPVTAPRVTIPDTLGPEDLLPEQSLPGAARRGALTGLLLAGGAMLLPQVVGDPGGMAPGPEVMGATLAFSAVVAYVAQRPGRPLPENVEINRQRRAQRERDIAAARTREARRTAGSEIRLTTEAGQSIACGPP